MQNTDSIDTFRISKKKSTLLPEMISMNSCKNHTLEVAKNISLQDFMYKNVLVDQYVLDYIFFSKLTYLNIVGL